MVYLLTQQLAGLDRIQAQLMDRGVGSPGAASPDSSSGSTSTTRQPTSTAHAAALLGTELPSLHATVVVLEAEVRRMVARQKASPAAVPSSPDGETCCWSTACLLNKQKADTVHMYSTFKVAILARCGATFPIILQSPCCALLQQPLQHPLAGRTWQVRRRRGVLRSGRDGAKSCGPSWLQQSALRQSMQPLFAACTSGLRTLQQQVLSWRLCCRTRHSS